MVKAPVSNAEGAGSIPGQGTKIPHASQHHQQIKMNKIVFLSQLKNKWSKDLKRYLRRYTDGK